MNNVAIKLTSAIGISGVLYRAGSIVEVSDDAAKNLLHRGKGVLATAADEEQGGDDFPDLSKMNKAKLLEIAAQAGLTEITEANSKAEITAAIEVAMKARAQSE